MGRAGARAFETERAERPRSTRGVSRDARIRPSGCAREAYGCCHGQPVRTAAVPRATGAGFNYRDGTFSAPLLEWRMAYLHSDLRCCPQATHMWAHTHLRPCTRRAWGIRFMKDSSHHELLAASVLQNVTEYPPYAITSVPARTVCTTSAGRRNWNRSKTFCEER